METNEFQAQIEDELKGLSKKDVVRFAGICALRALPFLGAKGNFNFWKEEDRQQYLYAVFYAIDINLSYRYGVPTYVETAKDAEEKAAEAYQYTDVARIAYSAVFATYTADADMLATRSDDSRAYAVRVAYSLTVNVADRAKSNLKSDKLQQILLQDIKNIREGKPITNTDTKIYGPVWDNFQKALADESCAYWGQLYTKLFRDGFVPDKTALEQRLNVPPKERSQGAASVAAYLERKEKETEKSLSLDTTPPHEILKTGKQSFFNRVETCFHRVAEFFRDVITIGQAIGIVILIIIAIWVYLSGLIANLFNWFKELF
jgi:hypothetical protein